MKRRTIVIVGSALALICGSALFWHFIHIWLVDRQLVKSAAASRVCAEQGDKTCQFNLGLKYFYGKGVPKDYVEAARWYNKAAQQGYARAQFNLGSMYHRGEGVQQDYGEAFRWCQRAAEQGDPNGQSALGYAYFHGEGVSQDFSEAAHWYRKAAEQGNPLAQQGLGYLYAMGTGVQQDDRQAVVWYRKAAEQGDAEAQQSLGYMYAYGRGVTKDRFEAVRWYRKAAKQGNPQAQHTLSLLKPGSAITRKVEYFWVLVGFPIGLLFSLDFLIPRRKRLDLRQTAVTVLGLVCLSGAALNLYGITHDDMQYSSWDITFRNVREFLALAISMAALIIILSPRKRAQG